MRRKYEKDCGIDLALDEQEVISLPPGHMAILHLEEVDLRDSDWQALLIPRHSTFGLGLIVTTTLTDIGFCGRPGLQVYDCSNNTVKLIPGNYYAQMIFLQPIIPDGIEPEKGKREDYDAKSDIARPPISGVRRPLSYLHG